MKPQHLATAAIALIGLAVAVENFYEHPTYGRGLQAAFAAINAAKFI